MKIKIILIKVQEIKIREEKKEISIKWMINLSSFYFIFLSKKNYIFFYYLKLFK